MRRLLVTALLALVAVLAVPLPATAGGPTSVVVTDPSAGRATALYYTDALYGDLDGLVSAGEPLEDEPTVLGSRAFNLTWMVHDTQPWRVQQLYPDAEGGPALATYGSELAGDAGRVTWSRLPGRGAVALVDRLLASGRAPRPAARVEPVVVEQAEPSTGTNASPDPGLWWLLPGAAAGFVVGAALVLLLTRRPRRTTEPRQVLLDLEPEHERLPT